jgi:hypothetical protein
VEHITLELTHPLFSVMLIVVILIDHFTNGPSQIYSFDKFPPFFEGLLPEGVQLGGLLKIKKIDKDDLFSQLMAVGDELVGVITVKEMQE